MFTPFSVEHKACTYRYNAYSYKLGGSKQLPGKGATFITSRVEEVATTKAEAPIQDGALKLQLSPISEPTDGAVQHIHGSESESGEDETQTQTA